MENLRWAAENWFVLLSAVGIAGGLFFDGVARRAETKTSRIANQISLVAAHRSIWQEFLKGRPSSRILDSHVDTAKTPITRDEEIFINLVIQHLDSVFYAMQDRLTINPEGLRRDIRSFFSLPITAAVWEKLKPYQNREFVEFVEAARKQQ